MATEINCGATPTFGAVAGLALSMLLSSLGTSIANVALPTFTRAFTASFQQTQWVVLAYLLAITVAIVTAGRLGDLFGRRRLLLGGIALFTAASLLCAIAPLLSLLIAARVAQGLGAAVMMALSMAFAGEIAGKAKTGRAMGLLGSMSAIGTALGPSLGGVLIAGFGWRAIFLVNLPLGLLALLLAYRHLPLDSAKSASARSEFDVAGTLALAFTLAAYALAMTIGRGSFGLLNLSLLLAAALGSGFFLIAEIKAETPLIPLKILRIRALGAGLATGALVPTVMMSTLVVGPFYLSQALGLGTALAGILLSVGPLAATFTAIPAGRVSDRLGAERVTIIGLIAMAVGSLILSMATLSTGAIGYVAPMVVMTIGYATFQTANNSVVMGSAGAGERGIVAGTLNLARNLGLITGASAMGAVFAFGSAATEVAAAPPEAAAAGTRLTFIVATILIALALTIAISAYASATRGRRGDRSCRA